MNLKEKRISEDQNKLLEAATVVPERQNNNLFFVTVVIAFLVLVSLPITWYFHCQRMEYRENLGIRTELEQDYDIYGADYDLLPETDNVNTIKSSLKQNEYTQTPEIFSNNIPTEVNNLHELNVGKQCDDIEDNFRIDCYPQAGGSQEECEKRGCCWATPKLGIQKTATDGSLGVPWCFYPENYPDYYLVNYTQTASKITAFYARNGSSYYPRDVQLVRSDMILISETEMNIKYYDANNPRYEVPYFKQKESTLTFEDADIDINYKSGSNFEIIRKSTRETLLGSFAPLFYTDQFIQISFLLPSIYIYGLGERRDNFLRSVNWQRYTMFAADQEPRDDSNLYGSHPFLLTLSNNSVYPAAGLLLLNSNAMDVILQPAPIITYRVIGGILDFQMFLGKSPSDVISQYVEYIGKPALPPYWALGFHLCRFGYKSANRTREIWEKNRKSGLPFDVQWNDIDYMDHRRDFTYDKDKFRELPQLVNDIHDAGMHYVVIIDPGIDYTPTPNVYPPFDEGIKQDIFIKDSNDKLFIGKVWSPNGAVFPDFTNPKTAQYWTQQLSTFHSEIPFDGIWIDMNEPSNFLDGTSSGCPNSSFENPPYLPNVNGGKLYYKTLCMTAKQKISLHYNVHNLYGLTEANATNIALKSIRQKRPFIISRSTFPGSGHVTGHWTGDISSTWDDMKKSIPGILDFNLFGVPLVGADICGFNGNTTVKLCQRWMELGAFYPFSRNHNTDDAIDQDPVSLGIVESSYLALLDRYMLLPYLYTLFYRSHVFGETVARPLFFEFPQDVTTYGIDSQFLWGSALMILPVLQEDVNFTQSYFPKGTWYIKGTFQRIDSKGTTVILDAPPDIINLAFRAGYIIPIQNFGGSEVTTTITRKMPKGLLVMLDNCQTAEGELFWDDGESLDTIENKKYNFLKFQAVKGKVTSKIINHGAPEEILMFSSLDVLGVKEAPNQVLVNGKPKNFTYHPEFQLLQLQADSPFSESAEFVVTWE